VSVADNAHARLAASAGDTVPLIEPAVKTLKANNPDATITASDPSTILFLLIKIFFRLKIYFNVQ
jgi:hypothetical protein